MGFQCTLTCQLTKVRRKGNCATDVSSKTKFFQSRDRPNPETLPFAIEYSELHRVVIESM